MFCCDLCQPLRPSRKRDYGMLFENVEKCIAIMPFLTFLITMSNEKLDPRNSVALLWMLKYVIMLL